MRRDTVPFVRTTKPMSSPVAAPAVACAVTDRSTSPPGASAASGGTVIVVPPDAVCGCNVTVHVPPPLPASVTCRIELRDTGPFVTFRSLSDTDDGSVKICGSFARATLISPAPSSVTAASLVRSVLPHAAPAVDMSADLTCCLALPLGVPPRGAPRLHEPRLDLLRRPRRMLRDEQRCGACRVRRGHARPVEDGEGRAGELGQRRREDLPAGSGEVRLQQVPERRRPRAREARDDAAASGRDVLVP